jgi:hypothetical protein
MRGGQLRVGCSRTRAAQERVARRSGVGGSGPFRGPSCQGALGAELRFLSQQPACPTAGAVTARDFVRARRWRLGRGRTTLCGPRTTPPPAPTAAPPRRTRRARSSVLSAVVLRGPELRPLHPSGPAEEGAVVPDPHRKTRTAHLAHRPEGLAHAPETSLRAGSGHFSAFAGPRRASWGGWYGGCKVPGAGACRSGDLSTGDWR